MLYLKNKYFTKWARKEGVSDEMLKEAIEEFQRNLFNEQDNLDRTQLVFLHKISDVFQKMSDEAIMETIKQKALIKISGMGDQS